MALKDMIPFGKKSVPIKREESNPFEILRQEMNSLFDSFFRGFETEPSWGRKLGAFSPSIDVAETDKEIAVTAELPGMDDNDIDVTINRETLTIKGEKKEEKEDKGKDYYRMERSYGSFTRTIPLPAEVETDRAEAHFKKGVLTVKIPKSAKAVEEKKKIPIKVE